jgi:hypothetical protein
MNPTDLELQRRATEARAWLRDGYTTAEKVDELMARIAKIRGQRAADTLRQDMREQWRCRHAWMDATKVASPSSDRST